MKIKLHTIAINGKLRLILPLLFFASSAALAQVAHQELGGTNVKARFYADGGLFWDGKQSFFEAPKGSGLHTISSAALWIGGYDKNHNIRFAAQTYREAGTDYWPGPLDTNGNANATTSALFNRVWKVSKQEIDSFRAGLSTPKSILEWPGNGDVSKGYAAKLAPYVDVDNNGIYEPSKGDYPEITGDEMLWWVFNDKLKTHTESKALPLGIEVQASAYSFNCAGDPLLNNTLFVKYKIINRSTNQYDSVSAGMWADLDIGNNFDDYVGSMPALNSFFGYNADEFDRDTTVVTIQKDTLFYKGYKANLPAQSVTFLQGLKNDNGIEMPMSNFIYYNNENSLKGNPTNPAEFMHYLNGHWMDGTPITVGGDGRGGTVPTNFAFPGDPADANAWSEKSAGNAANDRRALGAFGPITFNPGEEQELTVAFTFHRSASGKTAQSLELMKNQVAQLQQLYKKDAIKPCTGISLCQSGEKCVWPGDLDSDGKAYMTDIFHIGYAFGETGPVRPFASNKWEGQSAANWNKTFPNGTDFKYADANGDGVIDSLDVLPIVMNYSKTHNKTNGANAPNAADAILSVHVLEDSVTAGSEVNIQIKLNVGPEAAEDVYGVAFTLNYDKNIIDSGSVKMELDGSWLGSAEDELIAILYDNWEEGKTDAGIVRRSKSGLHDSGIIINFKYVISDNISGGVKTKHPLEILPTYLINSKLQHIAVITENDSINVYRGTNSIRGNVMLADQVKLYPNPANTVLNIDLGKNKAQSIRIFSIDGKEVMNVSPTGNSRITLDVNNIPNGFYLVQVQGAGGTVTKKFCKSN